VVLGLELAGLASDEFLGGKVRVRTAFECTLLKERTHLQGYTLPRNPLPHIRNFPHQLPRLLHPLALLLPFLNLDSRGLPSGKLMSKYALTRRLFW
jgi:hypothetical protein